jgi:hypothetical protein
VRRLRVASTLCVPIPTIARDARIVKRSRLVTFFHTAFEIRPCAERKTVLKCERLSSALRVARV